MSRALPRSFYLRDDVVQVARDLLGKELITRFDGMETSAIITETEAYAGIHDRASHAHGGRRTARTEVMYARGGTAYVYLCYGIHHLFNVVCNERDIPHAVLVRAGVPVKGVEVMHERLVRPPGSLLNGPGVVAKALGIHVLHTGGDLLSGPIRIADRRLAIDPTKVLAGPRIGVDYAGEDALLPYRFRIRPSDLR
jgi:DNA-3-methyladenine glycosylase